MKSHNRKRSNICRTKHAVKSRSVMHYSAADVIVPSQVLQSQQYLSYRN